MVNQTDENTGRESQTSKPRESICCCDTFCEHWFYHDPGHNWACGLPAPCSKRR